MPRPASTRPWTVAQLTRRVSMALDGLGSVQVEGELSAVKVAASGHLYATLKDPEAVVAVVMWRSALARNGGIPQEGERVLVRGRLEVYGPRGAYQVIATSIRPQGVGDLALRFEQLKERLEAEGLFAAERKRPLPTLPRGVGLATASGSAALADLVDSIRVRFPTMPIVHAPCVVQGVDAVRSIVQALGRLDRRADIDVIVVGRGGGSLEDLWAFNEEPVVRAIAACSKPVISAVGHETDLTLADLVADQRAKTPTMAGEVVVPVLADLLEFVDRLRGELDDAADELLDQYRDRLRSYIDHRALAGPEHAVRLRQQRLDEWQERLDGLIERRMSHCRQQFAGLTRELRLCSPERALGEQMNLLARHGRDLARWVDGCQRREEDRFGHLVARLEALSPLKVLGRGYALVRDGEGRVVRSVKDVEFGQTIAARVVDGWVDARVEGVRGVE